VWLAPLVTLAAEGESAGMAPHTTTTATDLRERLELLLAEREVARVEGLAGNELYLQDLDEDITAFRAAYIGTAVTEIATLRGELGERNQG
jgi:septum formation topological specificity factor MinE